MSQFTSSASVVATEAKARVLIFENRLPLRTRQSIGEVWLRYDYLDFGGHYFMYCPCARESGKYHCWLYTNPAYSDQPSYRTYLGLFGDYESLLPLITELSHHDQGKIIEYLGRPFDDGDKGEIEIPEC
jgi:hypothetical protein